MPDFTLAILDELTGTLILEDETALGKLAQAELAEQLGAAETFGCANPTSLRSVDAHGASGDSQTMRISGIWHDSLVEGPGRRSVVRMQGCPIRCKGCWVPQTHDPEGGYSVSISALTAALLDDTWQRSGVTILGGEPFAQPEALDALVRSLRASGCTSVLVYTGYRLETLQQRSDPHVAAVLGSIDVLIDGPYIESLASTAGAWTGSGNQRVITFI